MSDLPGKHCSCCGQQDCRAQYDMRGMAAMLKKAQDDLKYRKDEQPSDEVAIAWRDKYNRLTYRRGELFT